MNSSLRVRWERERDNLIYKMVKDWMPRLGDLEDAAGRPGKRSKGGRLDAPHIHFWDGQESLCKENLCVTAIGSLTTQIMSSEIHQSFTDQSVHKGSSPMRTSMTFFLRVGILVLYHKYHF